MSDEHAEQEQPNEQQKRERLAKAMKAVEEARARLGRKACPEPQPETPEPDAVAEMPTCCNYHTLRWLRRQFKSGDVRTLKWTDQARKQVAEALASGITALIRISIDEQDDGPEGEEQGGKDGIALPDLPGLTVVPIQTPEDARKVIETMRARGLGKLADTMEKLMQEVGGALPSEPKPVPTPEELEALRARVDAEDDDAPHGNVTIDEEDGVGIEFVKAGAYLRAHGQRIKLNPLQCAFVGGILGGFLSGTEFELPFRDAYEQARKSSGFAAPEDEPPQQDGPDGQ